MKNKHPAAKNFRIAEALAGLIGLEACLVMAGWIFGLEALTRISPIGINMKFPTALAFWFAAWGLYFITRAIQDNYALAQAALPGIALFIFLIMAALLAGGLSGGPTGLESWFLRPRGAANALGAGMPSLPTAVNFMLFGLAALMPLFTDARRCQRLKWFGYPIFIIGLLAVIGYAWQSPALYYQFTAAAVPMALNTALTFVCLGGGLIIVSQSKTNHEA